MLSGKKSITAVLAVCCIFIFTGCKGKIDKVKDGVWSGDKATTIGKALDNYKGFENTKWELNKTDNGKEYVEFSGDLLPSKEKLELANSSIEAVPKIRKQMDSINGAVNYYFGELYNNTIFGLANWGMHKSALKDDSHNFAASIDRYVDNTENGILARRALVEKTLESYIKDSEKIKSFYSSGNRMQVVYQFILNEDKSFEILAGGCRTSKEGKASQLYNPLNVLKKIYDGEVIDGVCNEPI